MSRVYYTLMARASKHQARAYAVEAEASRHEPGADKDAMYKREAFYLRMAKSAESRAESYMAMAKDCP